MECRQDIGSMLLCNHEIAEIHNENELKRGINLFNFKTNTRNCYLLKDYKNYYLSMKRHISLEKALELIEDPDETPRYGNSRPE